MEISTFRLQFNGLEAENGRLGAYDAAKSFEGFTWSLSVVLNYAVTGNIRKSGDPSSAVKIYILPTKKGSFILEVIAYVTQPNNPFLTTILGTVTVSAVTTFACAIVATAFNHAIGRNDSVAKKGERYLKRLPKGDMDDLVARIEPPLTRAHAVIGKSATTAALLVKKTQIVLFDSETKAFLESEIEDHFIMLETNVSAFNAVSNNGRLYDKDIGQTVPFSVPKGAFRGTKESLSESLRNYTRGWPSDIRITAKREVARDGRIKRYHISAAEPLTQEM